MEIAEVSAAIDTMAKNSTPKAVPNGICWKASGRLMKISPGPAVGSMPLAKMIGKIAARQQRHAGIGDGDHEGGAGDGLVVRNVRAVGEDRAGRR